MPEFEVTMLCRLFLYKTHCCFYYMLFLVVYLFPSSGLSKMAKYLLVMSAVCVWMYESRNKIYQSYFLSLSNMHGIKLSVFGALYVMWRTQNPHFQIIDGHIINFFGYHGHVTCQNSVDLIFVFERYKKTEEILLKYWLQMTTVVNILPFFPCHPVFRTTILLLGAFRSFIVFSQCCIYHTVYWPRYEHRKGAIWTIYIWLPG